MLYTVCNGFGDEAGSTQEIELTSTTLHGVTMTFCLPTAPLVLTLTASAAPQPRLIAKRLYTDGDKRPLPTGRI